MKPIMRGALIVGLVFGVVVWAAKSGARLRVQTPANVETFYHVSGDGSCPNWKNVRDNLTPPEAAESPSLPGPPLSEIFVPAKGGRAAGIHRAATQGQYEEAILFVSNDEER